MNPFSNLLVVYNQLKLC